MSMENSHDDTANANLYNLYDLYNGRQNQILLYNQSWFYNLNKLQ